MERECRHCGKKFHKALCRVKIGKGIYCSRKCAHEARTKLCKCRTCGKEWRHPVSQRGDLFCSMACRSILGRVEKKCKLCGKNFSSYSSREKGNRGYFCSKECYWKSMKLSDEVLKVNRRENVKKYRREHPEWAQAMKSKRRALEIGAKGHFTAEDWKNIKNLQNNKCAECGEEKKLTVDHVTPLSKGGSNYPSNIQGLCGSCNSRKWAKI